MKRSSFLQKYKVKSPVKFTGLSPTKYGLSLFNTITGSIVQNIDALPFAYVDNITKLENLEPNTTAAISFIGKLKWKSEIPIALCGEKKKPAKVCDAIINDGTCSYPISIWGDLINII